MNIFQGFLQVLRTWGGPQNLMGGGGTWGELKMLPKNTCEGVHLIVKLPAIKPASLQIY